MAIAFQEIVELSPQQIMATDPARRQAWEDAVKDTLNQRTTEKKGGEYVLLRSGQLVGAALMIFVKSDVLGHIKNVEGVIKKVSAVGQRMVMQQLTYARLGFLESLVTKARLPFDWISVTRACVS